MDIISIFKDHGLSISQEEASQFEKLLGLFVARNSQVNLSAVRDENSIIEKHFIDSIILNKFHRLSGKVLDIGTGGGFPGIPLGITNPDTDFTLLDSTRKKIDSVNHFAQELGMNNVKGVWGRAEEISKQSDYKGAFDFVVSRATAYLPLIITLSLPFLKKGGMMIFFKSKNDIELKDGLDIRKKMKFEFIKEENYILSGTERSFLFFRKS